MIKQNKYIGIIGALDDEISQIISDLKNIETKTISNITFYSGNFNNNKVVIAKCGVGKVFAGICAEIMILNYDVSKIIHIGIAGALTNDLKINDLAIASSVVQHDMDITAFNEPLGMILGINLVNIPCSKTLINELEACAKKLNINYKIGVIASGDQFINDTKTKQKIIDNFNAIACEMEGAATGQVCYINNIDFCVVRTFSDNSDENSKDDYLNSKIKACDTTTKLIKEYLNY